MRARVRGRVRGRGQSRLAAPEARGRGLGALSGGAVARCSSGACGDGRGRDTLVPWPAACAERERKACDTGSQDDGGRLAQRYEDGKGVPKADPALAVRALQSACEEESGVPP